MSDREGAVYDSRRPPQPADQHTRPTTERPWVKWTLIGIAFAFMALTIAALTFLYGLVLVVLAHRLAARIQAKPWMARVLNKIAGSLLIAFGLKLALSK